MAVNASRRAGAVPPELLTERAVGANLFVGLAVRFPVRVCDPPVVGLA